MARTGLNIGRIADGGRPSFGRALCGLFDPRVKSKEACQRFLDSLRVGNRRKTAPEPVRLSKAVHTAVFAPTGVGKGVSCVIPFLKECPESAAVVDFKGENAVLTAEHRRRVFGHRIELVDPYRVVTRTPSTLNPVDFIYKDSATAIDDCWDLAKAMVVRTGEEKDPHFLDSAEAWIAAMTAAVVYYAEPHDRSLQTVRTLLTNPQKRKMAIEMMCKSDAWADMLARLGNQLTDFQGDELGSVKTTTNRHMRFLDTPAIAESTARSSFDPAGLRKGKMTVYLILPPDHMRAQSPLLRLWIGSLMRAVVKGGLQHVS